MNVLRRRCGRWGKCQPMLSVLNRLGFLRLRFPRVNSRPPFLFTALGRDWQTSQDRSPAISAPVRLGLPLHLFSTQDRAPLSDGRLRIYQIDFIIQCKYTVCPDNRSSLLTATSPPHAPPQPLVCLWASSTSAAKKASPAPQLDVTPSLHNTFSHWSFS